MRFVSRKEWGAAKPKSVTPLRTCDAVVYHYTAADADVQVDHRNCAGRVRGIQRYHMETKGWNDIAYSFLVCKHGYVYEGRGYKTRSAATGNDNDHTLAVCFLGGDKKGRDDVTNEGRRAEVEITQAIEAVWKRRMKYRGHRDYMATSCPGDELYSYIRSEAFADQVAKKSSKPWPVPIPQWFWSWAAWKLAGSNPKTRPPAAPRKIPAWAWRRLEAMVSG
jgi:hypothetical protein